MAQDKKSIMRVGLVRQAFSALIVGSVLLLTAASWAFPVVVAGDSRNDVHGVLPKIVAQANGVQGLRMFIHLGDMTGGGQKAEFERYKEITAKSKVAVFDIPGNHDIGRARYYERYVGKPYFSRQEGRWRFIFIDNSGKSLGDSQLKWIKSELKTASDRRDYIVLAMHKPLYCPKAGGHIMEGGDRKVLLSLAKQYKVKLVLAAHHHGYANYQKDGITHLTTGGAGAPLEKDGFFHYIVMDLRDDGSFSTKVVRV